jgi:muramoyltetrapeptide carboxypeptidase LdcA involved in peptidoglycan recycling
MIRHRLSEWRLDRVPVAFDFPVGHVSDNLPMVEGAQATLTVSNQGTKLLQKLR